jgi:trigger factor
MDFIKTFKVTEQAPSQVVIEGEIPFTELAKERSKAIAHLGANVELDGFRKGHVPEKVLVDKIGEMTILNEMAERSLAKVYPSILKEHSIEAIGHPQVEIIKIAPNNPLGFKATAPVLPEVTLPDYKVIAGEINKSKDTSEVTDDEVETQAKDIIRQKVAYERIQANAIKTKEKQTESNDLPTPESVQTHTHADGTVHEGPAHAEAPDLKAVTDDELPELTDEYVKGLGQPDQFESVADFKAKLREHLSIQKTQEVEAAHRAKITDAIIEKSELELPQLLIDSEINQMFAQMNEDLNRANLKMDDYLGHIKKSKEDLIKEWSPAAEKRAKLQLILNEISKKEAIKPDQGLIDQQVDQLLEQYKDADEARVRIYVESVMTNDAVMRMLEEQK